MTKPEPSLELVEAQGCYTCLVLGNQNSGTRIAGPKPWGGGTTKKRWLLDEQGLTDIINEARGLRREVRAYDRAEAKKKNCLNCRFMEWADGDVGDPEGWVCNRKHFNEKEEKDMLEKMDSGSYQYRSKTCFKPRRKKNDRSKNKKKL